MRLLLLIPLLCIVLAVQATGLPPGIMVMDGRPAPALQLDNLDGESWGISNRHGHWLFVHFWASWCGPCRREMPTIQKLMETLQDDRLEIVLFRPDASGNLVEQQILRSFEGLYSDLVATQVAVERRSIINKKQYH